VERTDRIVDTVEEILVHPDNLLRLTNKELTVLYQSLIIRKEVAQKFILKLMELGIKTDFLRKMFDEPQAAGSDEPTVPKGPDSPNDKVRKALSKIQKVIDSKVD